MTIHALGEDEIESVWVATNLLLRCIQDAVRSNRKLGVLFAKIGYNTHPRGAMKLASSQMLRAFAADPKLATVLEVGENLRSHVILIARDLLRRANPFR